MIKMFRKSSVLILGFTLLLFSCDKNRVFDDYKKLGGTWHKDSIICFEFESKDTVSSHNLFVNVRNNNNYPFNNLFLVVHMQFPDGFTKVDTLEYQMANPDGSLMGEGFSDVKENKLWYKENVKFNQEGTYKVSIQHALRQINKIPGIEELKGVSEVGFRIESTQ